MNRGGGTGGGWGGVGGRGGGQGGAGKVGGQGGGAVCKVCLQTAEFAPSTSTPLRAGSASSMKNSAAYLKEGKREVSPIQHVGGPLNPKP